MPEQSRRQCDEQAGPAPTVSNDGSCAGQPHLSARSVTAAESSTMQLPIRQRDGAPEEEMRDSDRVDLSQAQASLQLPIRQRNAQQPESEEMLDIEQLSEHEERLDTEQLSENEVMLDTEHHSGEEERLDTEQLSENEVMLDTEHHSGEEETPAIEHPSEQEEMLDIEHPGENEAIPAIEQNIHSCATHQQPDRYGPVDPNYPFFMPRNPLTSWAEDAELADPYQESNATQPQAGQSQTHEGDEVMADEQSALLPSYDSRTDSAEFLAFKAAGRPMCRICLIKHRGPCMLSPWELELLQNDPEGYARYRKDLRKPKHRRRRAANPQPSQPQGVRKNPQREGSTVMQDPWRSPFVIETLIRKIETATASELAEVQSWSSTQPEMASLREMISHAQQQPGMLAASAPRADAPNEQSGSDSITAAGSADDISMTDGSTTTVDQSIDSRNRAETNEAPAAHQAADDNNVAGAHPATTQSSVDFRTGSERALARALDAGRDLTAKAAGKQPRK